MKIKDGFEMRDLCGEHILLACGRQNIDFSKVINLNDSAAVMWNAVFGRDFEVKDLASALLTEYGELDPKQPEEGGVSAEQALADATRILDEWKEIGIVEE
ncbi:MAG: PqqD family protein [Bacteroidales bacterium]|nr:PqqD family protein [Candidatus Physcousia equi]